MLFAGVTGSAELYQAAGDSGAVDGITRCLAVFRKAAEECGGRVVKTMGEEIMALFPTASAAADAAARMQTAVESLVLAGGPRLGARIAFHAGPVLQQDNDIFGDSVNVAARLVEQAMKGQILTTAETVSLLGQGLRNATRRLYDITVKGKEEPICIYQPLCEVQEASDTLKALVEEYHRAYSHYLKQEWDAAEQLFRQLQRLDPDTQLYGIYLQRIVELRKQQLPPNWDGTYRHTSK